MSDVAADASVNAVPSAVSSAAPASIEQLPPSMQHALPLLPAHNTPLILLTRHSIREQSQGQGFAGYDLPLTATGRQLAHAWGAHLVQQTGRRVTACLSSPIARCVDTAQLMLDGQHHALKLLHPPIEKNMLLVEPGSFVLDVAQAGPQFLKHGPLNFINAFLNDQLLGMKIPRDGVRDILQLLFRHQSTQPASLLLAVSHDTILAALLAVMAGHAQITWDDWPDMMEGVFLWFEGADDDNDTTPAAFESAALNWVWRGRHYQQSTRAFLAQKSLDSAGLE